MILLVRQELTKLYRRAAPWVIYALTGFLIVLFVLGVKAHHGAMLKGELSNPGVEMVGDPVNGLLICQGVAGTISILLLYYGLFVPGELVGGEAAGGTLRTILIRPQSRLRFWLAKYITAWLYALSLCAFAMLFSLLLGTVTFGWGQLDSVAAAVHGRVIVMSPPEALTYLSLSYAMLAVAIMAGGTLAFALGSWFESSLMPGSTALAVLITGQIVGALKYDWVEKIKPYLFTEYLSSYTKAFPTAFDPHTKALLFPGAELYPAMRVLGVTIAVFAALGLWRFMRKDVTC